jgi:hypothetical protein
MPVGRLVPIVSWGIFVRCAGIAAAWPRAGFLCVGILWGVVGVSARDSYAEAPRVEQSLGELTRRGWHFMSVSDRAGELVEVAGSYAHPDSDVVDTLRMRSPEDCCARRIVGNPRAGGGVTWKYDGDLFSCVEELLELPAADARATPRLVIAGAPTLWTPGHDSSPWIRP